jgi:hypothetical protein
MTLILSGTNGLSDVDGDASTPAVRGTDANTGIFFPAADTIAFAEGGVEAMRIDSSGNVGIGVTPSAWASAYKVLQIGSASSIFNTSSSTLLVTNGYIDSGFAWRYQNTSYASRYTLESGSHIWYTAPSGTAGNAITFTQAMTLDASGNLLVGTTSNSRGSRLRVEGQETAYFTGYGNGYGIGLWMTPNPSATGGTATPISFQNVSDATVGSISTTASATAFNTSSDYRLKENVAPMTGALAKVLELNPVTYTWKVDGSSGEGFIAHELQAVCPDAVSGEKDAVETKQVEVSPAIPATYDEEGNELTPAVEAVYEEREVPKYQGVDTSFLVATLTAAIQELKAELDEAKARIAALETGV